MPQEVGKQVVADTEGRVSSFNQVSKMKQELRLELDYNSNKVVVFGNGVSVLGLVATESPRYFHPFPDLVELV